MGKMARKMRKMRPETESCGPWWSRIRGPEVRALTRMRAGDGWLAGWQGDRETGDRKDSRAKLEKIASHIFDSNHLAKGQTPSAHPLIPSSARAAGNFLPAANFMLLDYLFELMCGLRFSAVRCLTGIYMSSPPPGTLEPTHTAHPWANTH